MGKLVYMIEVEGAGVGGGQPTPPIYTPPGHVGGGPVVPPAVVAPPIYLPGAPPGAPGHPANPIVLPPTIWPHPPNVPANPIVIPPDRIPGGGVALPIYPPTTADSPDNALPVPPAGAYVLVWVVGTDQFKLVYVAPPTAQPKR